MIPRADGSYFILIAGGQCFCRFEHNVAIGRVAGEAVTVSETAIYFEAHVVGLAVGFLAFYRSREFKCLFFPEIIAGVFIHIPQLSGEETAAPVA